jgi:hypothetical protein
MKNVFIECLCIPKCSTMHNRSYNFVLYDQWMPHIFARRLYLTSCLKRKKFYEIVNKEIWRHDDLSFSSHVKCFCKISWSWIRNNFFNDILGINAIKLCKCNLHVESRWLGHFSSYWSLHICGWHDPRQLFLSKFDIIIFNSKSCMHDHKTQAPHQRLLSLFWFVEVH